MQKDVLKSIMASVNRTVVSNRPGKTLAEVAAEIKDYHDVIPFGNYDLDNNILTIGGVPKGRITEISGQESSGKSTLSYRLISNCQKLPSNIAGHKGIAAFIDAEQCLSDKAGIDWIMKHDVDIDTLLYYDDIIAEDILQKCLELAKAKVDLIVVDSVPAMTARYDSLEENSKKKRFEDSMATLARVMSKNLNQVNQAVREGNTALVFINQLREKPNVMYGDNSVSPGGRALKYYSSVRLKIHKKADIKDGKDVEGILTHAFLQKSKVSPPLKKTGEHTVGFIPIYFDGRIVDDFDSVITSAIELGIIENPKGVTYVYDGIKAVGKKNLKEAFADKKDEITNLVKANQGNILVSDSAIELDDEELVN